MNIFFSDLELEFLTTVLELVPKFSLLELFLVVYGAPTTPKGFVFGSLFDYFSDFLGSLEFWMTSVKHLKFFLIYSMAFSNIA
jgi:hypothetical protein